MSESVQPGQIELNKITLTNHDGSKSVSLRMSATVINIYEDIMCPLIYAEIVLTDSADLHSSFPIIGEEFIDIEFRTPGVSDYTKYHLFVYSSNGAETNKNGRLKTYVLKCASAELIPNATATINQRKTGTSEDIIKDLITNSSYLNSKKNVNIEPTKGSQDMLISKLNSYQAIDLVRQRAVSQKYLSSSYCFFENAKGFNFATVEFLFDQGKQFIKDKIFFYDSNPQGDYTTVRMRNIIGMKQISSYDTTTKMHFGGMANMVKKFDIFTGELTNIPFNNLQKQDQFKFPNDKKAVALNSTFFESTYGQGTGYGMFVPTRSDVPDNYLAESLGPKQAFVQKIIQNIYWIHTYGDSVITAGDIITVNVPKISGTTENREMNKLISGNYLVAKLRHTIAMDKEVFYTNSMELIKGAYEDNV